MFRAVSDGWKRYWWGTGILPDRSNRVEDIYLRFYNGKTVEDYLDIPLSQASSLLEVDGFKKDNPTVLYAHGFIEVAQQESIQVVVSAYLEARPDTNVVLLDWSNMAHGSYVVNAARNTKKVGTATAEQINKLSEDGLPLEKLHVVGHSLGSHVAGYTAKELKNKYNKTVKRLTALDPAFPAFYPDGVVMEHVSAKDAEFVDVIHTDAGGYGAPVKTGTADFWPNGGKSTQPGCPRFAPIPLSDENLCSHWRSWWFYAESVRNPEAFPASPADSFHKFKENPTPEANMVYMGYNCDTRLTALDPAFPAFYPDGVVMEHISAKDAEFVDVIHTDAGGYGAPVKTGTADFWPNGGKSTQPGCPRFAPIPLSDENLCSHWRSWWFYAESVRNPEAFPASPADSFHKFKENPTPEANMVYMGYNCDTSAKGSYFLTTNGQSPFGKGMDGIYHKSKKKTDIKS